MGEEWRQNGQMKVMRKNTGEKEMKVRMVYREKYV
jgi:hypothetical protein